MVTKLTITKKKNNKENNKEAKADEAETAEEEQEASDRLVTHLINILHSIFSNAEV